MPETNTKGAFMTQPLRLAALIAALAGTPALAQDTDAPADPDTGAPAGNGGSMIGGQLDLGEGSQQANPQTYVKETFGDWSLQCIEPQEGNEICQMYQLLEDASGSAVAEASVFKLENGGQAVAGGTFVVPLETLLTQKLTIAVDGGQPRSYDYSFCNQIGCYARVGFTEEDVNRFKAGAEAQVRIVPALAPDQEVVVTMSLTGFTAAYEEASSLRQ